MSYLPLAHIQRREPNFNLCVATSTNLLVLNAGIMLSIEIIRQCLGTFLNVLNEEVPLASSAYRPRVLLNMVQCTGLYITSKNYLAPKCQLCRGTNCISTLCNDLSCRFLLFSS